MDELVWKWVLNHFNDQILLKLSNEGGIKIPGFRKLNVNIIKQVKKKLIADMVKGSNLIKICDLFNMMEELDNDDLREMDKKDIMEKLESKEMDPCWTLALLLSSGTTSHREKAREIFQEMSPQKLEDLVVANGRTPNMDNEVNEKKVPTQYKDMPVIKRKLKKSEEKNHVLKSQLEKERNDYQILRKGLLDEQKDLKQKLVKLQQACGRLKSENQTLTEENRELHLKNKDLSERLEQKEKTLAIWMTKVHMDDALYENQVQNPPKKKKIALIGDPKNQMIMKAPLYEFHLFDPTELQSHFNEDYFLDCDEIWLLTYRTPLAQQLHVKRKIEKQKRIEFRNFVDLRNYIRERISE